MNPNHNAHHQQITNDIHDLDDRISDLARRLPMFDEAILSTKLQQCFKQVAQLAQHVEETIHVLRRRDKETHDERQKIKHDLLLLTDRLEKRPLYSITVNTQN